MRTWKGYRAVSSYSSAGKLPRPPGLGSGSGPRWRKPSLAATRRLGALAATSPVFAPGAANYVQMGAIDALWDGDLAADLLAALRDAATSDTRRELGRARGGRKLAATIAERTVNE